MINEKLKKRVEDFKECESKENYTNLMFMIVNQKLKEDDFLYLINVEDERVRAVTVLQAPYHILVLVLRKNDEKDYIFNMVIKRLVNDAFSDKQISMCEDEHLNLVVHALRKNLSKNIIKRLKLENLDEDDLRILKHSQNDQVRDLIIEKLSRNDFIEYCLKLTNKSSVDIALKRLKDMNITCKEADKLALAEDQMIRFFAYPIISVSLTKKLLLTENVDTNVTRLLGRIDGITLLESEYGNLLRAKNYIVREYALFYAGKNEVLECINSEENINVTYKIITWISNNMKVLTAKEKGDIFYYAKSDNIVEYMIEFVSKRELVNYFKYSSLISGNKIVRSYSVTKKVLKKLKEKRLTSQDIETIIINPESFDISLPFMTKKALFILVKLLAYDSMYENYLLKYEETLATRIKELCLSEDEAKSVILTLSKMEYWSIINKYIIPYVSDEFAVELTDMKYARYVYLNMLYGVLHARLSKITLNSTFANKLVSSGKSTFVIMGIPYADIDKVIALWKTEHEEEVIVSVLKRLTGKTYSSRTAQRMQKSKKLQKLVLLPYLNEFDINSFKEYVK